MGWLLILIMDHSLFPMFSTSKFYQGILPQGVRQVPFFGLAAWLILPEEQGSGVGTVLAAFDVKLH